MVYNRSMKKGVLNSKQRGFTIIEVTLVIAIAGLIFLMVFVALPGLRASQRDAERREDMSMFLENVKKYQTNNRGALPGLSETDRSEVNVRSSDTGSDTTWAGFYQKYLGNNFIDPSGGNYRLRVVKCGAQPEETCDSQIDDSVSFPNDYTMLVVLQASCKGPTTVGTSNLRKLAVVYKLEGAGVYCVNT